MAELLKGDKNWWKTEEGKTWVKDTSQAVDGLVEELRAAGVDIISARMHPDEQTLAITYNGPESLQALPKQFEGLTVEPYEWRAEERELIANLHANAAALETMLETCSSHWGYEDPIYRYYHHSFKVYYLQKKTEEIVKLLKSLAPGKEEEKVLNGRFMTIINEGTGKVFERAHNKEWDKHTRPIVEAFFHAKYFLEMAVRYSLKIDKPQQLLPSGWAAFLYLFNLR